MLGDQYIAIVIAVVCIAALEAWRRSLRHRAPRWIHPASIAMLFAIAAGVVYSQYALRAAVSTVEYADAGNKATHLARSISHAMKGNVAALAAAVLAVVVLAIGSWQARRAPDGGPRASIR